MSRIVTIKHESASEGTEYTITVTRGRITTFNYVGSDIEKAKRAVRILGHSIPKHMDDIQNSDYVISLEDAPLQNSKTS